ncbi:MAG: minor capsid protein, partial [Desulfovibrio sp.]|nr:minor capsid protein [Desulfovibrio sp.]
YLAIMDKRTRPSHAVLHEKIYPADHEFWDSNYPPNGFRCRCAVRTLSERQVGSEGLTVEKEMPKPQFWTDPATNQQHYVQFPGAEKGFRNNPAKEWLEGKEIKGTASHLSGDPFFERFKNIVIDVFKINPDYYINAECRRNCQRCVLAYERRRRGDNVEAMPNPYPDRSGTSLRKSINGSEAFKNAEIHGINHKGGKAIGKEELKAILKKKNELPDGARAAIFWVKPDRESSHIIVCEKIGERVVFIDPQSGARGDAALRKCYAPNGYSWYRIDNLELNEDFEWNEVIKDARL